MEFLWNCYKRAGDDGLKNTTDMEQDRQYMKMALELAQKGMGFTAPNPMVGAVIVKKNHWSGISQKIRRTPCGERSSGSVYGRTQRSIYICYFRTLLPLWKTASMRECNPGGRNQTRDHRIIRS